VSEIIPPGDNLKHYCNVRTVNYVHNFILSALSVGLMKTKYNYVILHPSCSLQRYFTMQVM